jgi:hypothetical protein
VSFPASAVTSNPASAIADFSCLSAYYVLSD